MLVKLCSCCREMGPKDVKIRVIENTSLKRERKRESEEGFGQSRASPSQLGSCSRFKSPQ